MKLKTILSFVLGLLFATTAVAEITSKVAFETLADLKDEWGEWKFIEDEQRGSCSKGSQFATSPIVFKLIGRGSAIQEDLMPGSMFHMATIYHLEDLNDKELIGTHYCALQNQPSFKADLKHSTNKKMIFKCDEKRSKLCNAKGMKPGSYVDSIVYEISQNDDGEFLTVHYMGRGQKLNDPDYTRCKFFR